MALTATLDRQTKDWALLCLSDGRVFDISVDGGWKELKEQALEVAAELGVEIEGFNSELPEDC